MPTQSLVLQLKRGWDCLRHYEIIAAGCLPYFPGIVKKPSTIMTNYPVELQIRINDIFESIILSDENIDSLEKAYQQLTL